MCQAWGVLESQAGNYQLARRLFRCAVKAHPQSEPSWKVWPVHPAPVCSVVQCNSPDSPCYLHQGVLPARFGARLALPVACAQSWAKMEEDLGFLQRADDLRRYSIEEQQEVRSAVGLLLLHHAI